MMASFDPHYFTADAVREWKTLGDRHTLRDSYFLAYLQRFFRPGPILELGAATGHMSEILYRRGYDVMASDVSPAFVGACAGRGLNARVVDATEGIRAQTGMLFANILAQNVLPLILRDEAMLRTTLGNIHAALLPSGRVFCISAHATRRPGQPDYFRPREQIMFAERSRLFRVVKSFPHQVVPTGLYRRWNAPVLNFLDFRAAMIAAIRLVWIMEKVG
jgi:SAM-dependent methyltransferase